MPKDGYIKDEGKKKLPITIGNIDLKGKFMLIRIPDLEIEEGGIVVDEQEALLSRCHGYRINLDGKVTEMVWSPGIIGTLSKGEKEKYCVAGIDWEEPPVKLKKRLRILHQAGIFKKK